MAEKEQEAIAKALVADGFDPPPTVGQRWEDVSWKNATGEETWVELTSIGKTISGWQAHVTRRTGPASDSPVMGRGVLYVERLMQEFRLMDDVEG